MQYAEYIPSPALQPYVKCIWLLESDTASPTGAFDRILPDGSPELIFHFDTSFEKKEKHSVRIQPSCFLYGQLSSFIELRPVGKTSVIGIRFFPYGLSAFTFLPQHQLTDRETALQDVFSRFDRSIHEQLHEAGTEMGKVLVINRFLSANLVTEAKAYRTDQLKGIAYVIDHMRCNNGVSIQALSSRLHISNRELERRFRRYTGLSPKQLSRTFRFQEVLQNKYLLSSLTAVAYASGYYDQSHFIRDFKTFSGLSPRSFIKEENSFAGYFREG